MVPSGPWGHACAIVGEGMSAREDRQRFPVRTRIHCGHRMKNLILTGSFLALVQVLVTLQASTPASLDPTFSPPVIERNGAINAMAVQGDGRIVIGGRFSFINGIGRTNLARLNADGSLDSSFRLGSVSNRVGEFWQVGGLALDLNGRIIMGIKGQSGGANLRGPGVSVVRPLVRLSTDGAIDPGFQTDALGISGLFPSIFAVAVLPNGNIVFARELSGVTHFNPNSFQGFYNILRSSSIYVIRRDGDGTLLFGGYMGTPVGGRGTVVRYGSDGTADARFKPPVITGTSLPIVQGMVLDAEGRILIGGAFTAIDGVSRGNIARLNRDGSRDDSFSVDGANGPVSAIEMQNDDRIVVGGKFSRFNGLNVTNIVRLFPDGSIDPTFRATVNQSVSSLLLTPSSELYVGGEISAVNSRTRTSIAKYSLVNEDFLESFSPRILSQSSVSPMSLFQDHRIVIAGDFSFVDGLPRGGVAVLTEDGHVDGTFDSSIGTDGLVRSLAVTREGKIVIGGDFDSYQGHITHKVARINLDGSPDTSFVSASSLYQVYNVGVFTNGAVLTTGPFGNDTNLVTKARLNPDGSVDTGYSLPVNPGNSSINVSKVEPDGKVILGGYIKIGATFAKLARFNVDGSLDTIINTTLDPYAMAHDASGRALVGGYGKPVRVLTDGTIDPTFQAASVFDTAIFALLAYSDGTVFADGYSPNDFAHLFPDGRRDTNFALPVMSLFVSALAETDDGRILVAWGDNNRQAQILRLMSLKPSPPRILSAAVTGELFTIGFQTTEGMSYTVEYANDLSISAWKTLESFIGNGTLRTATNTVMDSSQRFYRVRLNP